MLLYLPESLFLSLLSSMYHFLPISATAFRMTVYLYIFIYFYFNAKIFDTYTHFGNQMSWKCLLIICLIFIYYGSILSYYYGSIYLTESLYLVEISTSVISNITDININLLSQLFVQHSDNLLQFRIVRGLTH